MWLAHPDAPSTGSLPRLFLATTTIFSRLARLRLRWLVCRGYPSPEARAASPSRQTFGNAARPGCGQGPRCRGRHPVPRAVAPATPPPARFQSGSGASAGGRAGRAQARSPGKHHPRQSTSRARHSILGPGITGIAKANRGGRVRGPQSGVFSRWAGPSGRRCDDNRRHAGRVLTRPSPRRGRRRPGHGPGKSAIKLTLSLDYSVAVANVARLNQTDLQARSSVGEHYLDTVGVGGSIPPVPTIPVRGSAPSVAGAMLGALTPHSLTPQLRPEATTLWEAAALLAGCSYLEILS